MSRKWILLGFFVAGTTTVGLGTAAAAVPAAAVPQSQGRGVIVFETDDPVDTSALQPLIEKSAQPDERLIVLDPAGLGTGTVLATGQAPPPATIALPRRPRLPSSPTSFQLAEYHAAVRTWEAEMAADRRLQARRTAADLGKWASSVTRTIQRATDPPGPEPGVAAALDDAAGVLLSLTQAGVPTAGDSAIVLMGQFGTAPLPPPRISADLGGSTVVVEGFSAGTGAQAAWQGALIEAGASRAAVLDPAESNLSQAIVQEALSGARTQPTETVSFDLGQATILPRDAPPLAEACHFLRVVDPGASATVVGSTDGVGSPSFDNALLAAQRAAVVKAWLIANDCVAPSRVDAVGIGALGGAPFDPPDRKALIVVEPLEVQP